MYTSSRVTLRHLHLTREQPTDYDPQIGLLIFFDHFFAFWIIYHNFGQKNVLYGPRLVLFIWNAGNIWKFILDICS